MGKNTRRAPWGSIVLGALLGVAILALQPLTARAALSDTDAQGLRRGHDVQMKNRRLSEVEYSPADKATRDQARQLAARLGAAADAGAMALLAEMDAHDLLDAYRGKYRAGTTPELVQLVMRYHREEVGLKLVSMLREVDTRPLFDVLLDDVKRGLSWDVVHVDALARATLPGIEPELLPLLGAGGDVRMPIARKLLRERRYRPAVPVATRLLLTCDRYAAAELAHLVLALDPEAAMGPIAQRLVAQAVRDGGARESDTVRGLAQALGWIVPPWMVVPRTAFNAPVLRDITGRNRQLIDDALARRDEVERLYRERSYDSFAWFVLQSPRAAERLVAEGFDVHQRGPRGTPMQLAMEGNDLGLVSALLHAGTDPNSEARGYTVLHWIVAQAAQHEAQALEVARMALDRGARIDALSSRDTMTPLHYAVRAGSPQLVALLLERGASTQAEAYDAKGVLGVTPLQLAQETGNPMIEAMLRARGATLSSAYPGRQAAAAATRAGKNALGILLSPLWLLGTGH